MTRKQFIESFGATCQNWQWSWSFVNHDERFVIFGAWDRDTDDTGSLILSEDWQTNDNGRRNPGYEQSRNHIGLIEEDGYTLKTFPMAYSDVRKNEAGLGPATIKGFTPELSDRRLKKIGNGWYATDIPEDFHLAEEISSPEQFTEGASTTISINAYERNSKARQACINYHGLTCTVCGMNFESVYGDLGKDFIHVHHLVPIGKIGKEYKVDPTSDLIPVCPNCHAMIHRADPPLTITKLRKIVKRR